MLALADAALRRRSAPDRTLAYRNSHKGRKPARLGRLLPLLLLHLLLSGFDFLETLVKLVGDVRPAIGCQHAAHVRLARHGKR